MMQVWLLFNIIEACIGSVGIAYHICGFTYKPEALEHIMVFCGTFFGFTLMSLTSAVAIIIGGSPPVFIECVINFTAAFFYIFSSILSMYYAEQDFHLMYLSDFEEPTHPYFVFCRSQSICALAAGILHFLHALLATDALLTKKVVSESEDESSTDSDEDSYVLDTKKPMRMYFLSKFVENKLRRYAWFDNLCRRQNPKLSIFSFTNSQTSEEIFQTTGFQSNDTKISAKSTAALVTKKTKPPKNIPEPAPKKNSPKNIPEPVPKRNSSDSEEEKELKTSDLYNQSAEAFESVSLKKLDEKGKEKKKPPVPSATHFALPNEQNSDRSSTPSKQSKDEHPTSILRRNITPSLSDSKSSAQENEYKTPKLSSTTSENPSISKKIELQDDPTNENITDDYKTAKLSPTTSNNPSISKKIELQDDPFNESITDDPLPDPNDIRRDVGTLTSPYESSSESSEENEKNETKPKPTLPPAP